MINNHRPVIFVTGGSRGIGKAIVDKFKAEDWLVAACATTQASIENSAADLKLSCDVGDTKQVQSVIQSILSQFGRLDAVVNNAGIAGSNSLNPEDDDELWHKIIDVNLHGTYYISKYALPHLPDNTGRIVNISSVLGLQAVPDQTAYCASKHAVMGLTKSLSGYAAPRKITVNAICPGWVRTDMAHERMQEIGLTERRLKLTVPLGRFVEPSEVADLTFYLVSSSAGANITGQAFTIDGGALV